MTSRTALITGATAGIGRVFVELLAAEGHNLVLVARDRERLQSVAAEMTATHGVECEVLSADLTDRDQLRQVEQRLHDDSRPIDALINNAGLGIHQPFVTGDVEREQYLLDILVTAVMRLTHAAASGMKARGNGDIVIVSSVASFVPLGTYSAAKSWNTLFAEGLSEELRGSGVRISALCPGFTHTEFHDRAGISKSSVPSFMWLDAKRMVEEGWRQHQAGRVVSIPTLRYRTLVGLMGLLPRRTVRRVGYSTRNRD